TPKLGPVLRCGSWPRYDQAKKQRQDYLERERFQMFTCTIFAGGNPLNHVAEALLYAPMFSEYTKSSISNSGSSSESEIVSSASQVCPNTAHTSVLPFLNARK